MNETTVESELREFATRLVEHSGGIVDWPSEQPVGLAMAPLDVAHELGQTDESFPMTLQGADGGLRLDMGGEFIDVAANTLNRFVPARGGFALPSLPVKKTAFQRTVDEAFGWLNARGKVVQGSVARVIYHTWWFHVVLHSEDAWESLVRVSVNCDSQLPSTLDNLLTAIDLAPTSGLVRAPETAFEVAARQVEERAVRQAEPFIARMEQRLGRDQARLREYYRALEREAATPNRRRKTAPTPEEITARQRAIKLELRRKLSELQDRFTFNGILRPAALAEFQIPGIAIDVRIQRKTAVRTFRLFWNGLLKRLEPMRCARCGNGAFNFWFTNDVVDPICNTCHEDGTTQRF